MSEVDDITHQRNASHATASEHPRRFPTTTTLRAVSETIWLAQSQRCEQRRWLGLPPDGRRLGSTTNPVVTAQQETGPVEPVPAEPRGFSSTRGPGIKILDFVVDRSVPIGYRPPADRRSRVKREFFP